MIQPEEKAANTALLARVVMGWTSTDRWALCPDKHYYDSYIVCSDSNLVRVLLTADIGAKSHFWDPCVNIADAMEMLLRFKTWCVETDGDGNLITAALGNGNAWEGTGEGETTEDAICAACLEWARAQGEKR